MTLTGDKCQCPTRDQLFNSTYAFDKHRVGTWGSRRCLTDIEMRAKGMAVNRGGFWISQALPASAMPIAASGERETDDLAVR